MRWLLFLGRIAFICNIFFILSVILRYWNIVHDQTVIGFVVVLGMLMAPLLNFIFNLTLFIAYFRKTASSGIPAFIIGFNLIVLVLQFIIIPFV